MSLFFYSQNKGINGKIRAMRTFIFLINLILLLSGAFCYNAGAMEKDRAITSAYDKEIMIRDMAYIISGAWKKWQDAVVINDIEVEGSTGLLTPGDMSKPVFSAENMLKEVDFSGKSEIYTNCIKTVIRALDNGMARWQRGYSNMDIPFPLGASCTYTLPACNNVPVSVSSGASSGDSEMTRDGLYNYMLYYLPDGDEGSLLICQAAAESISVCFLRWKESCSIVGIVASGGIAPQPAPMGQGPGPVKGAKGNNGKLVGRYFDTVLMRDIMISALKKE